MCVCDSSLKVLFLEEVEEVFYVFLGLTSHTHTLKRLTHTNRPNKPFERKCLILMTVSTHTTPQAQTHLSYFLKIDAI